MRKGSDLSEGEFSLIDYDDLIADAKEITALEGKIQGMFVKGEGPGMAMIRDEDDSLVVAPDFIKKLDELSSLRSVHMKQEMHYEYDREFDDYPMDLKDFSYSQLESFEASMNSHLATVNDLYDKHETKIGNTLRAATHAEIMKNEMDEAFLVSCDQEIEKYEKIFAQNRTAITAIKAEVKKDPDFVAAIAKRDAAKKKARNGLKERDKYVDKKTMLGVARVASAVATLLTCGAAYPLMSMIAKKQRECGDKIKEIDKLQRDARKANGEVFKLRNKKTKTFAAKYTLQEPVLESSLSPQPNSVEAAKTTHVEKEPVVKNERATSMHRALSASQAGRASSAKRGTAGINKQTSKGRGR